MILRNRFNNPDALISIGMTCLAAGIVSQRFLHPVSDFWQGSVAGVSGVLIGLSIVCNVRGLVTRNCRKHGD
jgi:hypothetical protein